MTRFQLDQCTSSRRVVDACRAEGHGEALPLPRSLHDTPDGDLVPAVLAGGAVFVTTDRLLPRQCAGLIPEAHPGIVVVTNYPHRHQTLTVSLMLRLLGRVKARVPDWSGQPLANSVLEVTAEGVAVGHVRAGVYEPDGYFEFARDDWPGAFLAALRANASRSQGPPAGPQGAGGNGPVSV